MWGRESAGSPTPSIHLLEIDLGRSEIAYIPNEDFDTASEQDFAEIDGQLYADEEESGRSRRDAEAFLMAIEASRLLTVEGERFLFKRLNFLRFRANALQASLGRGRAAKRSQQEIDRLLCEANQTRDQIACANLRLAASIVRKYSNSQDDFDEFLAEANAILLNAVDKFDYSRGYRFSTYATHAIQRHIYRLLQKTRKARDRQTADGNDQILQIEASPYVGEAACEDAAKAMKKLIASFDRVLDDREQEIVRRRFGLNASGKGASMRAIGDDLGISKERVRQLLNSSIEKLAKIAEPLESILQQDRP